VNHAQGVVNTAGAASAAQPPLTQFGRAMQPLGVRIVPAYSPQAKGRVERCGTGDGRSSIADGDFAGANWPPAPQPPARTPSARVACVGGCSVPAADHP